MGGMRHEEDPVLLRPRIKGAAELLRSGVLMVINERLPSRDHMV